MALPVNFGGCTICPPIVLPPEKFPGWKIFLRLIFILQDSFEPVHQSSFAFTFIYTPFLYPKKRHHLSASFLLRFAYIFSRGRPWPTMLQVSLRVWWGQYNQDEEGLSALRSPERRLCGYSCMTYTQICVRGRGVRKEEKEDLWQDEEGSDVEE